ncbi:MAG TPA: outer membrane beta-barrel protein [Polyangia bacterium]|nr:outer membrane beta-barrel protein [Polyangia bacterium]
MRFHLALGAAMAALIPLSAFAQTTPPPAGSPPEAPPPTAAAPVVQKSWRDLVTFEGLADAYASWRPGGSATVPAGFRVFDAPTDTFSLAFAKLAVGIKPEPVGLRLDLGFGPVADITASQPGTEVWKHVLQAYASFALPGSTPITIDAGKFVTAAGAEVIEAHANWNYSRSFLFGFAIPFTHTGIRLTAPLTSQFTLQVMLANGWDLGIDNNAGKTLGVSGTYAAPFGTTFILNFLAGPEDPAAGNPWRVLVDAVVSQTVGKLSLSLNVDYGHEDTASWYGAAGYARMALTQMLNLSLRGEIFQDHDGFRLGRGVKTTVGEVTATVGVPVGNNAEVRLEGRGDFAGSSIYEYEPRTMPANPASGDPKKVQVTLTAAALVWF